MPITSEKVLRKMNEIQSKGGEPIGHWHILRRWLLEDEQVQENFFDAVENDPDMTPEQKEYWLSQSRPTLHAGDGGGLWACPKCSHENHAMAIKCYFCDAAAPNA